MSHPESDFHDLTNAHADDTPAALLEQLVYIDNLMPDADPSAFDAQLSAELAAFADESFIFPDEDKPQLPDNAFEESSSAATANSNGNNNNNGSSSSSNNNNNDSQRVADSFRMPPPANPPTAYSHQIPTTITELLRNSNDVAVKREGEEFSHIPKAAVPPGAHSSLSAAGLSQAQIDALAVLVAQQQQNGQQPAHLAGPASPPAPHHSLDVSSLLNAQPDAAVQHNSTRTATPPASKPEKFDANRAVDLDKRRRNTAASARFRVKKKEKEKEMERNLRDLSERNQKLEMKIQQLEMENRLLRNLVVEKGAQRDSEELERLRKKARSTVEEEEH